ncbi:MAG: undecaprenyl-diphosphate phosphatase [Solirubrobacteraceae bacterium]
MPTQRAEAALRALVLGLVQGPSELAPVSSSAHLAAVRALLDGKAPVHGSGASELAARRKALDVALHGGGAIAIAIAQRSRLLESWSRLPGPSPRRLALIAASLGPPSAVGHRFEQPIERRLGGPRSTAAGLAVGGVALMLADARRCSRSIEQARLGDGLALGVAQAAALLPGVSRRGATLAIARARRFGRADADALSWLSGLPVILAAVALKAARLARDGRTVGQETELLTGAVASFCSTLLAARAAERTRRDGSLLPYGLYRLALALALALARGARRGP